MTAFYKGVGAPLFGTGFLNAVIFGANGVVKGMLQGGDPNKKLSIGEQTLAGAFTGVAREAMLVNTCVVLTLVFVCRSLPRSWWGRWMSSNAVCKFKW